MISCGRLAVVVAGLLALGLGCGEPRREPEAAAAAAEPVTVATQEVRAVEGVGSLTVPATVRARRRATLSARIMATVEKLPYRQGEAVGAGAVVAALDGAALRSAVVAARTALSASDADERRMQALAAREAATPREVEVAATRAAAARAALAAALSELSYAVLRAPFAGTVTALPVDVGDVVAPGATLVELEGRDGHEVRATVESRLVGVLAMGQPLEVEVDGLSSPVAATLVSLSPAGDPATHRFELRADLAAVPGLRSGLFARVVIAAPTATERLLVPAASVLERGALKGVYVIAEGRAQLRWLALGEHVGERVEVRAGLEPGERVAVDPRGLSDGVPVRESR